MHSKGVFRTQSNIYDGAFCENIERLLVVNYFCKKGPLQMFDWGLNTPLHNISNFLSLKTMLTNKYFNSKTILNLVLSAFKTLFNISAKMTSGRVSEKTPPSMPRK